MEQELDFHDQQSGIDGVIRCVPRIWRDNRGGFEQAYVKSVYHRVGIADQFVQDNVSYSHRNVVRGLHCDPCMSKLVHVLQGEVYDVVVDARRGSATFGKWESFELSRENRTQIYIPAGCLHGFMALTDDVIFCYKQSAEYNPSREIGVRWDDSDLAIVWPNLGARPILSEKDKENRSFREAFPSQRGN